MMKIAIIYKSIHHGNTKKIDEVMAEALEADLFDLKEVNKDIIREYDLIGLGSGKYFMKPHKKLRKLLNLIYLQYLKKVASTRYSTLHKFK